MVVPKWPEGFNLPAITATVDGGKHKKRHERFKRGSPLTASEEVEVLRRWKAGESVKSLAAEFAVKNPKWIYRLVKGETR